MRIHDILPISKANGPGPRFVIWVQGCSRHCPGCFNPQTHDPNGGYELDVREIIKQIPVAEVAAITVSGGEPFEQPGELGVLLEEAGEIGLNRMVYTGLTYEELAQSENREVEKCLSLIDVLIDGAYIVKKPPLLPWTGSENQRILQLRNGQIEKTYGTNDFPREGIVDGEVIIDQNGNITASGIMDSAVLLLK